MKDHLQTKRLGNLYKGKLSKLQLCECFTKSYAYTSVLLGMGGFLTAALEAYQYSVCSAFKWNTAKKLWDVAYFWYLYPSVVCVKECS